MELWRNWIISLIIVGIVSSLVQIFVHGGKSEKTVRKCTGIILALVIIAPLPAIFNKSMNFDSALEYLYPSDEGYGEFTKNYVFDVLSRQINAKLEEKGIKGAGVTIDGYGVGANSEINFVIIKLPQNVIVENEEHINKRKQIVSAVTEVISIPEDKIIIYE